MIEIQALRSWRRLRRWPLVVGTLALTLGLPLVEAPAQESSVPEAIDQGSSVPLQSPLPLIGSGLVESLNPGATPNYRSDYVYLDGRPLFLVTAPTTADPSETEAPLLIQRIRSIQRNLNQILRQGVGPEPPTVEVRADEDTGSTVIYVNDRYLMTVTDLDAEIQGMNRQTWAWVIRRRVRDALIGYHQERQVQFLLRQALIAGGILAGVILLSWILGRWERWIQTRRESCEGHLAQPQPADSSQALALVEPDPADRQQAHRQVVWLDMQHRLIQVGRLLIWGGSLLSILGLFPQTRWIYALHDIFVRGRIVGLLGIGASGYVGIKLSNLGIHSFFSTIRRGKWLAALQQGSENSRLIKRLDTLEGVVRGTGTLVVISLSTLITIGWMGVNVAPVLTSLGFVGLGISLAAQDLIKDLINGMMILLEDQFAEGDVIVVDGRGGLVEHINLRITQLRNTEGTLITIPNSTIRVVENLSNGWSRVDLMVQVAFDTDVDQAIRVIESVALHLSRDWHWKDRIIDTPQMLGVDDLGQSGVTIRIWIKVRPLAQWDVAREFRRRLKIAFDQNGIRIPYAQQDVWFRNRLDTQDHSLSKEDSQALSQMLKERASEFDLSDSSSTGSRTTS